MTLVYHVTKLLLALSHITVAAINLQIHGCFFLHLWIYSMPSRYSLKVLVISAEVPIQFDKYLKNYQCEVIPILNSQAGS